jgi:hypothetical protein
VTGLVKFLLTLTVLGALVYGGLIALALFVEPQQREMSVTIPPQKLVK